MKRTNRCESAIDAGRNITLSDIRTDLNSGNWDALYFASEAQIDEDFGSRYQDYQEELRCMLGEPTL